MSFFEKTEMAPADPILSLTSLFKADPRKGKINLGVGTYKSADLKPYLFPSVKVAEKLLAEEGLSKEYLPIEGEAAFLNEAKRLILGDMLCKKREIALVQGIGGTGALAIGARFLKKAEFAKVYLTDPSWDNHRRLFSKAGFEVESYPYYDFQKASLNIDSVLKTLKKAPKKSLFVMQPATHNPTGCDPTKEEWKEILKLMKQKNHFPFFDFCYQGFGDGLEEDAEVIRFFIQEGVECFIATSFSKNFGLYAERVGGLFVVAKNEKYTASVVSQLKVIIRTIYSNPPCHGSRIVTKILSDDKLSKEWKKELEMARGRLLKMRKALSEGLIKRCLSRFSFIKKQKGLFTFTGLDEKQVARLNQEFAIHLPKSGRINLAGLNEQNVETVAQSIACVLNA